MVLTNRSRRMVVVQIVRTVGFVAAALLLNDAIARSNVPYGPYEPAALVGAILATEVGLCSVWAIIARDHWLVRLLIVLAVSMSVWKFLHNWSRLSEEELLPACWVQAVIIMGALLGLRAVGFRLVQSEMAVPAELSAPVPRYSIRDIMILTALVALALAAVIRLGSLDVMRDARLILTAVGAFLAAITLLAVLTTLMLRQSVLPALVTCGAGVLLGWGIGTAVHYNLAVATIAIGAPTGLQVAALLLWRQAGYRFIRPGRTGTLTGN